jgi:hypothetical protein
MEQYLALEIASTSSLATERRSVRSNPRKASTKKMVVLGNPMLSKEAKQHAQNVLEDGLGGGQVHVQGS